MMAVPEPTLLPMVTPVLRTVPPVSMVRKPAPARPMVRVLLLYQRPATVAVPLSPVL
jgi:hypothetical protein